MPVPSMRWVVLVAILVTVPLLIVPAVAHALEVIQLRTGQVGGVPGVCPGADDNFTYNPVSMPPCPQPFRPVPFISADFTAAASGPPARVVAAYPGFWLPSLSSDPLARWIDWDRNATCWGMTGSVLYACKFVVTTPCATSADIGVCWAVDDYLGDPNNGPNPIGIYINGVPLGPAFSGGNYATETCQTQVSVPVHTGVNYLYAYQRDGACTVSGLMLSATVTVARGQCPSIGAVKFYDANGNGVQDTGEPGLSGWQINLNGPVNMSGVTDANGNALFSCLPAGTYQLTEVNQPGWIQTTPLGGVNTLTINCGQDYICYFGNRRCDQTSCTPLPNCASGWFPFDECSGTTANEVVANRDGTINGGPTWGAGSPGSPCSLLFPGLPGTQSVTVPNYPEHNFGTGSFTVFAWIKTNVNDSVVHCIVDKRQTPFSTPTGYSLFLYNGIFRLQLGDGSGPFTNFTSTAPPVGDGQWHTVAVTLCRTPGAQPVLSLYVDSHLDTFTSGIPTGSLTNTAGLVIGDQCPGFIVGNPFNGAIDDVQLYKCCLSANQIASLHNDLGYCKDTCYVPSILSAPFGLVTTTLTLCNYATTPQTYTWSIAGLPAGPGCSVNGPTGFGPSSGTVTLPAAVSGPACVNVPIVITRPPMGIGQTACYQVTVQNNTTMKCCVTRGRIRRTFPWHVIGNPTLLSAKLGQPQDIHFVVYNDGPTALQMPMQFSSQSADGDQTNQVVSLNGLPPGQPWFSSVTVGPMDSVTVAVSAELMEFQPFNINEVVFSADADGDGIPDDAGVVGLVSTPVDDISSVPPQSEPSGAEAAPAALRLTAAPNPFEGQTGVQISLARAQSNVRVEVFGVGGNLVRTVFAGSLAAGTHSFSWDGLDAHGVSSGSGLYFLRARAGESIVQIKLIRTR